MSFYGGAGPRAFAGVGGDGKKKPEREMNHGYAARNSSRSRLNVSRIASAGRDRIGR